MTAVFGGDIGPMQRMMAQLNRAMEATAANAAKQLTFRPRIDDTSLKAASAQIAMHMKQLQSGAAFRPVVPPPVPVRDFAASNAEIDRQFARASQQDFAARRGAGLAGGGNRNMQIVNTANQLQDIAVQIQMGTRLTTIFAQQVPQLLSAFGPNAAILGGAAALGGLLLTVGDNARRAFDAMIHGAAQSRSEIDVLLKSGGVAELSGALEKLRNQEEAFASQRQKSSGIFGALVGGLNMIAGGKSKAEQESDMIAEEGKAFWARQQMAIKVKEASADELKIAQLRAKGLNEEADEMERKVALARKLAEIEASTWSAATKAELSRNAIAMSEATATTKKNQELQAAAEARRQQNDELRRSIEASRAGLAQDRVGSLSGVDRLTALQALQTQRQNDATLGGLSLNESRIDDMLQTGDVERADKSLKLLRDYEATQREIEALQKSLRDQAADEAAMLALKATAIKDAREEFAIEFDISQALAAGDAQRANALEDQLAVLRLQKGLMDQLDISAGTALELAQQKVQADRASADAVKQQAQAAAQQETALTAAINRARVRGFDRKAERLESQAGEDAKAKALISQGVPESEARERARQMQRDEDKLAGRATRIRSGDRFADPWGIDAQRTPGLDAMQAQAGKKLRDEWSFPALDAMSKRQQAVDRQRGPDLTQPVELFETMVRLLTGIETKIDVA